MLQDLNGTTIKQIEHFALAVVRSNQNQNHCGICYKDENGDAWLLHLAWHHKLYSREFLLNYQFVEVKKSKSILKYLAVLCDLVRVRNPNIPYGLNRLGFAFDPTDGSIKAPAEGCGLTCASFILAILDAYGLTLLKEDEWPESANAKWQEWVVRTLEETEGVSPEHLAAEQRYVGKARRFSPEEVVAASSEPTWPLGYNEARMAAQKLLNELN